MKKDKVVKDMYRRLGNVILKYIKEKRTFMTKYSNTRIIKYSVKKAKRSILLDYANMSAYLEYEMNRAMSEYEEMLRRIREKDEEEMEEESEMQ